MSWQYAALMAKAHDGDDIGTATRALAEAVSALTRSVTQNLSELGQDVNTQVAGSLRAASRELADASTKLGRSGRGATRAASRRTRERLLASARKLFAERGYEAASLGDVAADAGFTKGAVYANFAGKEDLLLAVAEELASENERWLADGPTAAALGEATDDPAAHESQLLAVEISLYAARHPEVRERIAGLFGPGIDSMARLVAAAPDSPGSHDRDTAAGLIAIRTYIPFVIPILADADAAETSRRLAVRLLAAEPDTTA
ncbi:TetR/AcrR family transcriptional regulator [Propionicicella superfundia]|uniref:TetR/AcrR family transcriptional regulator n=1 Tax=Propionicicella superfundia TaxID=348582 RepID=UPI000402A35B|nr:TetR/AcrR family transcriptional regulator [Propionicicella superfundia]